jgi:hypothetical protein
MQYENLLAAYYSEVLNKATNAAGNYILTQRVPGASPGRAKARTVAQVVEHLRSFLKSLSSLNPLAFRGECGWNYMLGQHGIRVQVPATPAISAGS